jgi:tetratricopeptide (TPR) repeat protein
MRGLIMIGKLISLLTGASAVAEEIIVTNDDHQHAVYERGSGLISPHMHLLERGPKVTKRVCDQVSKGIRDLDAVTTYNPKNWAAFWIKGKGYQVLGDHASAHSEFKSSFGIQKENPDVSREYVASCLELGFGGEGMQAAKHAIELIPADAGLHANLALALLISGENQEAKEVIEHALELSPDDKISQAVMKVVDDVIAGKNRQPKTMADLGKS